MFPIIGCLFGMSMIATGIHIKVESFIERRKIRTLLNEVERFKTRRVK